MSFGRATQDILHYGKVYKGRTDFSQEKRNRYLKAAAKLYATTDGLERKHHLLWWWEEGVRDYCENQKEIESMKELLRSEAVKHITEGRY